MSADKKSNKETLPHPAESDARNKRKEEFDKNKDLKNRKSQRVNYVVKDLPIY